jgi:hypothetical protein
MQPISFARHQFPPEIIRHAAWLYLWLTLSYRDVGEPLAERGLDVSHETLRRWVLKFRPLFARICAGCDLGRVASGASTRSLSWEQAPLALAWGGRRGPGAGNPRSATKRQSCRVTANA